MFDIGWSEMAVVLLVALIVIGPKDLPTVARTVGRWVGKARAMAREFQRSFEEMAREAELDEIRKEIDRVSRERIDIGRAVSKTVDGDGALANALDPSTTAGSTKSAVSGAAAPPATIAPATAAAESGGKGHAAASTPPATPENR
jgi:sec-independent protein translocase protein TatB